MRFCIIGGGGYFGQHLARDLQKEGHHTVLLDLAFEKVPYITLDEDLTTRAKGSLLDDVLLMNSLEQCDACFHLAAYGMSGTQSVDREGIFLVNVEGTRRVISACRRHSVRRLVFSSSVGVVFTHNELIDSDETVPYPKDEEYYSHYSASKAVGERLVLAANGEKMGTTALRLRGIYGTGEPRATDRAAEMIHRGLMVATFNRSLPAMTQYSGVDNCSRAFQLAEEALRDPEKNTGGQVYNIVDEGAVPAIGFWHPLFKGLGRSPPSIHIPYLLVYFFAFLAEILSIYTGIPPVMNRLEVNLMSITNTFSIEKAKRDLGYNPINNHDTTELVAYYKQKFSNTRTFESEGTILKIGLLILLLGIIAMFVI